jgi:hypothetical protein
VSVAASGAGGLTNHLPGLQWIDKSERWLILRAGGGADAEGVVGGTCSASRRHLSEVGGVEGKLVGEGLREYVSRSRRQINWLRARVPSPSPSVCNGVLSRGDDEPEMPAVEMERQGLWLRFRLLAHCYGESGWAEAVLEGWEELEQKQEQERDDAGSRDAHAASPARGRVAEVAVSVPDYIRVVRMQQVQQGVAVQGGGSASCRPQLIGWRAALRISNKRSVPDLFMRCLLRKGGLCVRSAVCMPVIPETVSPGTRIQVCKF